MTTGELDTQHSETFIMYSFDENLEMALELGRGRTLSAERRVPMFVPKEDEKDNLYEAAINRFRALGFKVLDMRSGDCESVIASAGLTWPEMRDEWPDSEFDSEILQSEEKVLIVCGEAVSKNFWTFLGGLGVLNAGSDFPQAGGESPLCLVVPDAACVVGMARFNEFFGGIGLQCDGSCLMFDSV